MNSNKFILSEKGNKAFKGKLVKSFIYFGLDMMRRKYDKQDKQPYQNNICVPLDFRSMLEFIDLKIRRENAENKIHTDDEGN